jgi:DNA polymerase III sliding clamp (beta) subunit (PCNA family)
VLATATLKAALADVAAAVPTRPAKPVLACVLLGGGTLTATDLELQIAVDVPYDGEPILLPFARLRAILAEARSEEVTITPDGTSCVVAAGRGTWRLPVESAAEWPTWNHEPLRTLVRVPCDQFARAVKACVYATDGDDAVQLEASEHELVATLPGCVVTARQIAGRFPRWRDVLPKDREGAIETVVDRDELMAATRAAAIVTSEQSKGVDFTFSADGVTLHGQSAEYGQSDVTIEVVSGGDPVKVKLDPVFVVEWLRGIATDEGPHITVELVDAQSACVLRNGGVYTGVIMPLSSD